MPNSFDRVVRVIEKAAKREHHRLHHKVLRKRHPHARKGAGATGLTHRRRVHSKPFDYANFGKGYSDGAPNLLGRIVNVSEGTLGSYLSAAASAGDSVLHVDDAIDFDGDGGTLTIGAETLAYASCDEDANTVTLTGTLASPHAAETQVALSPLTTERWAHVLAVDEPDGEDTMAARVPHALYDRVAVGVRDASSRESVECAFFGDDLVVTDVTGKVPAYTLPLHHVTHEPGGSDAIKLSDLTSAGFLKQLSGNLSDFLRGDGTWGPSGGLVSTALLPYRDIQAFLPGSGQTWTKPTGFTPRVVTVLCIGPGGGGGAANNGNGGGGGGGGGVVLCYYDAADLPATVNVDVGAGGAGSTGGNGAAGSGSSRFGSGDSVDGVTSFLSCSAGDGGFYGSTRLGGTGGTYLHTTVIGANFQVFAGGGGGNGALGAAGGVNGSGGTARGGGGGGAAGSSSSCSGGQGAAGAVFNQATGGFSGTSDSRSGPGGAGILGQTSAGGGGGGTVWPTLVTCSDLSTCTEYVSSIGGHGGIPGGGGGGGASAISSGHCCAGVVLLSGGGDGGDGLVVVMCS